MSSQRQKSRPPKGLLALFALLGLAMLGIPFLLTSPAFLYIQLTDSVFEDSDFSGKTLEITSLETSLSHSANIHNIEDAYLARAGRIDSGESNWTVNVEGYYPEEITVNIPPLEKQIVPVSLKPKFGRIKVLALNVLQADSVIDADVTLTMNDQQVSGNTASGLLVSNLSPGQYSIKGEANGYYPEQGEARVMEAQTTEVRLGFAPRLKSNEAARIVLQWDKNPRDLDSHLYLPQSKGLTNKHIYFLVTYKKASLNNQTAAMLDVDDTTSYGPETVTIYNIINGTFKYGVHHYAGTGTIGGTSKAKIRVFTHKEIREFLVPPSCTKKWWYVFDLRINGTDVEIIPKSQCANRLWRIKKK